MKKFWYAKGTKKVSVPLYQLFRTSSNADNLQSKRYRHLQAKLTHLRCDYEPQTEPRKYWERCTTRVESKRPRHEEKLAPRRILRSRFTAHTLHYIGGRGVHGRGTRRHCTAVKCILSLAHLWPLSGSQCPLLVFIIQPVQRGADLRLLSAAPVNEPLRDFSMGPSVFLRLCCVSPS